MIVIHVHNAEDLAKREVGRVPVFFGRTFGYNIQRHVERRIVAQLESELKEQGVDASISVEQPGQDRGHDKSRS